MSWKGCGQGPSTLLSKVTETCLTPHSEQLQLSCPDSPEPASSIHGLQRLADLQDSFQTLRGGPCPPHVPPCLPPPTLVPHLLSPPGFCHIGLTLLPAHPLYEALS